MIDYSNIRHVHLEISTRCNAACPDCPRNLRGVDVVEGYPLHDMQLTEAKTIFPVEFLQQLDEIYINGNLGDFVTARDALEIVEYFRESNPKLSIQVSTNAGAKTKQFWQALAGLDVQVTFCIDGLEGTHELYRQNTTWSTVTKNAKSFIASGGRATWKMIRFDHNVSEEAACRSLAKELGFVNFQYIDHGRNSFPVFDNRGNFRHDIGTHSQPRDFKQLHMIREENKKTFVIPDLPTARIDCWSTKHKSIYVTATGEVYPCCWMGFYPGRMYHQGNEQVTPLITCNNSALAVGIENAIAWFNRVEETFTANQTYLCNTNCGQ